MTTNCEFLTTDLCRVEIRSFTLQAEINVRDKVFLIKFEFGSTPFSHDIRAFLIDRGPHWTSRTLQGYCHAIQRLLSFSASHDRPSLTSETFAAYTEWLKATQSCKGTKLTEESRRFYGSLLLQFIDWLADGGRISLRDAHAARQRHRAAFKGSAARKLELMRANAIPPERLIQLRKAVRLEYEECQELLQTDPEVLINGQSCFPLLPFSILLGIDLAVRPVEFNHMKIGDLRGDRLLLRPPNKEPSEVALTSSIGSCFELAQKVMSQYRTSLRSGEPLMMIRCLGGPWRNTLFRFDTVRLNKSLERFYEKYFEFLDPDGIPCLYTFSKSEQDPAPQKCHLPFKTLRGAAITEAARHERNPETVMRFARHLTFDTTMKFYIHEAHEQWLRNIATYLAPSAEMFRISLANKIASPQDEGVAQTASAKVPGGHCQQAVSGDYSCRRASDCRLCPFFRIHISRKSFFVQERDEALSNASNLENDLGLTRDAQNLREFAALNQAIIDRIDDAISQA
ncbi:MAG TPA: hypothetical protein VFX97_01590 [Pyrinomonadaceae bacterium]|nr:hypothetical protein [Pyrinomonadaceae bacterium]